MKRPRNRLQLLLVLFAGTLWISGGARAEQPCIPIHAMGEGQVDFATSSSQGRISRAGLLDGTTLGQFTFTGPNTYDGTFTITTKHGTLVLREFAGVFNAQTGTFSNQSVVIEGTGTFAGATGGLFFEGVVAADGSYTDEITGTICLDVP